jgi:SAM-dependent methyltransferase
MNAQQQWNERYAQPEYAYGCEPNAFFAERLSELSPGKILLPADGEGRNGVFAATLGWQVRAFDISIEGQKKAEALAEEAGVTMQYQISDVESFRSRPGHFDCIGFFFAHVPPDGRTDAFRKLVTYLKPGGVVLFEGYRKEQLGRTSGGPKDYQWLFSKNELLESFGGLRELTIIETETTLSEGLYHQGKAMVIRLVGKK